MLKRVLLLVLFLTLKIQDIRGQTIPLGQWEIHFNYLSTKHVLKVKDQIFCASYNGLFSVNTVDNQIKRWSKINGLSETGISAFAYSEEDDLVLLAYRNGNLDFVFLDEKSDPIRIEPWRVFNETPGLPENKAIKQIHFKNGLAYLCTGFGIVVMDIGLKQVAETYRYIGTNGIQVSVTNIAFSSDSLFAVTSQGLLATSVQPSVNRQYFANWKQVLTPGTTLAIASYNDMIYAGISGQGLFQKGKTGWKSVHTSNSKHCAMTISGDDLLVTLEKEIIKLDSDDRIKSFSDPAFISLNETIETDTDIFWAADNQNGLLTNTSSAFQRIGPGQKDTTLIPRQDSSIVDLSGLTWTRLPEYLGGGILVKNTQNQQQRVLSTSVGNGSLPSSVINSLTLDTDGFVWFASDKGVGYVVSQGILEGSRVDAILPVYGQRKLFSTEKCTSIAVEPGNRKWIGTRTGLFLFSLDGTELIQEFTARDSPLPSDQITTLQFDGTSGVLFVETPNGLVSYQSNSTLPSDDLKNVTIFPNPVRPGYAGQVGIRGVMQGSTIKITALSGRLIYQTKSEGGTASWNLNDYTGRRTRGGVYMVFIISGDGTELFAGKLAVIE